MNGEQLLTTLKQNEGNIAFVVGNGIHRHFGSAVSWDNLMKILLNICFVDRNDIPSNIPNTELYDIIELRYLESCRKKSNARFLESLKTLIPLAPIYTFEGLPNNRISACMEDGLPSMPLASLVTNSSLSMAEQYIEKRAYELFEDFGLPSNNTSSYTNMNLALELATGTGVYNLLFLKNIIKIIFCNCELDNRALAFVLYAKKINAPILTTNYDEALSKLLALSMHSLPSYFEDKYYLFPLSSYFCDKELQNPLDGFSIWHINGTIKYQNSIRLGLCDYMELIQRLRECIDVSDETGFISLVSANSKEWKGNNTWLEIFFKKHLFIFGLGLNEDEIPLRWLLIQRAKYNQMFDKKLKSWYIAPFCEKEKSKDKETFLKSVNVEMIYVDKYPTIYEKVWKMVSHD